MFSPRDPKCSPSEEEEVCMCGRGEGGGETYHFIFLDIILIYPMTQGIIHVPFTLCFPLGGFEM